MKILTPFKSVPENYGQPGATSSGGRRVINPFDQIAIEEALRLRERGVASEIVAVTVGPDSADEEIRAAYAMGCDRAIRIDDERSLDPHAVARLLLAVVRAEAPELVLMGKQAVDDDASQVGPMLAGLLGWPQATFVSRLEPADDRRSATCTRETDGGLEVITVQLPAVVTTDLRLNEPRYVSLPGLIKARRKPIELKTLAELASNAQPLTAILRVAAPPKRSGGVSVESVAELVHKLKHEAKVI
ncbi:MAG: electron transfer flavoprotein subunit beta/FixA family protein [Pirellulales bacterium]